MCAHVSDGSYVQVGQRADDHGRQQQASLAQQVDQQDRERVTDQVEHRVPRLRTEGKRYDSLPMIMTTIIIHKSQSWCGLRQTTATLYCRRVRRYAIE